MTHAPRDITNGMRRRPHRGRGAGWLFALLVMCFAVLPHITLAASAMRMPMPASSQHGAAARPGAGERTDAPAPCHESMPAEHPASTAPLCCIIGCGLIAQAPAAPSLPVMIAWSPTHPSIVMLSRGLSIEPAERPPRSLSI
ncbi:hypothetical protein AB4Z10_08540 [Bosea sp. RAF48]|uniref:hypothetical protein n=1 Tax=Bosea sp. RAF48 TaxID=3237480 RepID=UPI003F9245A2